MNKKFSGAVLLSDGLFCFGESVGFEGVICGELIFQTSQTGYQEIMTDASYHGQIIVFTAPHIGNVGIHLDDMESLKIHAAGVIMRNMTHTANHPKSGKNLSDFFYEMKTIAISAIDTRALTLHIRNHGSQIACLMAGEVDKELALKAIDQYQVQSTLAMLNHVSCKKIQVLNLSCKPQFHLVIYDFGVKQSIIQQLLALNCQLTIVPYDTTIEAITALKPDAVILSNGPGDASQLKIIIENVRQLLNLNIPLLGICLGHQLLALASGAQIKKMLYGHHGANHPVKCLDTNKVFITSQNHQYVVAEESLPNTCAITHRSLFDNTIAGIKRLDKIALGFQGHPEAGPGPCDLIGLFNQFLTMLEPNYAKAS
jgi:carbamoyl-phosphate synthase small subunit